MATAPAKLNERVQLGGLGGMLVVRAHEVFWDHARAINRLRASAVYTDQTNIFYNVVSVAPYRANISGAVTIDLAAAESNNLFLTLIGNVTSFALTNPQDGATYNIKLINGASWTFAGFPSVFLFDVSTVFTFNTTAGKHDFVSAVWDEVEGSYSAAFNRQMTAQ